MKVTFSKEFITSSKKLSGKELQSLQNAIAKVKAASTLEEITDCKKLVGYKRLYRIRIGGRRAFFSFHVQILDSGLVMFHMLIPRGQAYAKKVEDELRRLDKRNIFEE